MATWSNLNLQDSASPVMEQLNFFHDHSLVIISLITVTVGYMLTCTITNKITDRLAVDSQALEAIWTFLPTVTLIFVALPSLRILYLLDENLTPQLTLKAIGHQWYWSYEYSDFLHIEFDSFMTPTIENLNSDFRLLEVNNRIIIPDSTFIRMLITAADVLHSWAIPSLGLKMDANPGRLNQTSFEINFPGLLYGQCSEICGAIHSFMPIVLEVTSKINFSNWVLNY